MPTKPSTERAALEAIARLESRCPIRADNAKLVDRNLAIESGLSRATLARNAEVMDRWRNVKLQAVSEAMSAFRGRDVGNSDEPLSDADLLREARIDAKAFSLMPAAIRNEWEEIKSTITSGVPHIKDRASQWTAISSLAAKLYALTLAVRQRDQKIAALESEIECLRKEYGSVNLNAKG